MEDEVDLASVAMLVPLLCRVVTAAALAGAAEGALAEVNSTIRSVLDL